MARPGIRDFLLKGPGISNFVGAENVGDPHLSDANSILSREPRFFSGRAGLLLYVFSSIPDPRGVVKLRAYRSIGSRSYVGKKYCATFNRGSVVLFPLPRPRKTQDGRSHDLFATRLQ